MLRWGPRMFWEKNKPGREAKSGEWGWSSPGPGQTKGDLRSWRARARKGRGRAEGPRARGAWVILC